jgi:pseudaminic acid cytidylyltransferase
MKRIAIIPARGGSKRIPRKNIKLFIGKPIIAYSIEAALKSNLFDKVIVSTDDKEIAEIALKFGAKVPFLRSQNTSNDFSSTFDVIEEVSKDLKTLNEVFDYTCCIYPCAPFTSIENLLLSYNLLIKNKFDSVFPILPFSVPIQRALTYKENKIDFLKNEYSLSRSQDLEKSYHDAGQFYWINTQVCLDKKKIVTDNSGGIIISELEGQDIDNEIDWKLAELKYELLQSTK